MSPGIREAKFLSKKRYRDVAGGDESTKLTVTHWNIALATAFGWFLDSMTIALWALMIPYLVTDFHVTLNYLTFWQSIAGLTGILTVYMWPWLSDIVGRRLAFTVNIALTGIFVVLTAISQSWLLFTVFYTAERACLNGEWSIAANLTAETWPAKHRSKVLSGTRSLYGLGVALAGVIGTTIIVPYGWRWGWGITAVLAIIALIFRLFCPESPHWARTRDRRTRIRTFLRENGNDPSLLSDDDREWWTRAGKVALGQIFERGQRKLTIAVIFVAFTANITFIPVGTYAPLFLQQTHHWTAAQASNWYVWFGIFGMVGYWVLGWISDRWSRFSAMAIGNAITVVSVIPFTLLHGYWALWIAGCVADFGLIGVWGVVYTYSAELFPTRIRGVGNGVAWAFGGIGAFAVPYATVWLQDLSGSFALPFMLIAPILVIQIIGLRLFKVEYSRRTLDSIRV